MMFDLLLLTGENDEYNCDSFYNFNYIYVEGDFGLVASNNDD